MDRCSLWFLRYVCDVSQVKGTMRKHSELFLDSVDKVYTYVCLTVPRDCWDFCFMAFISNVVVGGSTGLLCDASAVISPRPVMPDLPALLAQRSPPAGSSEGALAKVSVFSGRPRN